MSHGHGEHSGAGGCGHHHGPGEVCDHEIEDPEGQTLFAFIDTTKVRGLNESVAGSCVNPFKPYSKRAEPEPSCESNDDDPELILYVPFTRVANLKSISVVGGHRGEGTSPSKIKLFIDREDVDFTNCHELPPTQQLELIQDNFGAIIDYPLKMSKFQNVSSLTIYVSENHGGDFTSISYIGLKGEVTSARHGVVECVYESSPQLADHPAVGDFMSTKEIN